VRRIDHPEEQNGFAFLVGSGALTCNTIFARLDVSGFDSAELNMGWTLVCTSLSGCFDFGSPLWNFDIALISFQARCFSGAGLSIF